MKTKLFLIITILFMSCDYSFKVKRGNGAITSREYQVKKFDRINAGGNYKINLIAAKEPLVNIKMDENLYEYLGVEVQGDELFIQSDYNLKPTEPVQIDIYYVELEEINSSGASSIEHQDILKSDVLNVSLSGAGAITLNLDVDELNLNLSGAGAINLVGYVYSQVINLSGAGSLDAKEMESRYAEIIISGIGNAKVNVKKELNATISGMGNIEYFGQPAIINQNISGLGKIKSGEPTMNNDNI